MTTAVDDPHATAVRELLAFLRFPSVGSDPARAPDVRGCAAWLVGLLGRAGFPLVRVARTPGHPIVYAESVCAPGRPTVLLYGHYDVQPPGPAVRWTSPPFEPAIRDGAVFARGSADDKGPVVALAMAAAHWFRRGGPPVNVKMFVEGEEESGSPNLAAFVRRHRRRLAADVAVVADTPGAGPDRPALVYGLRGNLRLELEVAGPPRDLHSGLYGGAVHNPVHVLADLIAGLHDAAGRVTLPDFYPDVRPATESERRALAAAGPPPAEFYRDAGVARGFGEEGFSPYERAVIRPAVVVTGVSGGDPRPAGAGIVPARTRANVNVRLAPDQDPDRVTAAFRRYVAARVPPTVRATIRSRGGSGAVLVDPGHPAFRAAAGAVHRAFGVDPVLLRCGGTIPVVGLLRDALGVPTVLFGLTRPTDGQHGPDERFHLADLRRGTAAVAGFLAAAAHLPMRRAGTS